MTLSTVERVEQRVREGLLRGDYAPGTWLRQDDLAAEMGVSKIPVREALQRLAGSALVTFEPNRGAMIRPLTAGDADEVFALRLSIEPELLRRAMARRTIVDVAKAELALTESAGSLTETNWRFHHATYAPAGWPLALATVETLHAAVAPYVLLYTEALGGGGTSDREHHELLELFRAGNLEQAEQALRAHVREAADAVRRYLSG